MAHETLGSCEAPIIVNVYPNTKYRRKSLQTKVVTLTLTLWYLYGELAGNVRACCCKLALAQCDINASLICHQTKNRINMAEISNVSIYLSF